MRTSLLPAWESMPNHSFQQVPQAYSPSAPVVPSSQASGVVGWGQDGRALLSSAGGFVELYYAAIKLNQDVHLVDEIVRAPCSVSWESDE